MKTGRAGKMLGMLEETRNIQILKVKQNYSFAVVDKFCFSAQNPRAIPETNGTFTEFIDEYVKAYNEQWICWK